MTLPARRSIHGFGSAAPAERRREAMPGGRGGSLRGAALAVVIAVVAFGFGPGGVTQASAQMLEIPRDAIERVIRDYLLSHPEVIMESLRRAQQQERESARARSRAALQAHQQGLLRDPGSPVGGNPAGDVTVVEFFDYRCPHCRRMEPLVKALVAEDRGIRLVYKEFPILGEESTLAARAALAARAQGKYLEARDRLMGEAGPLTGPAIVAALAGIGLDGERLRADMEAPEITALIERENALARALGIDGTPAFVVGGELVVGAVDLATLRELVQRARRAP